MYIKILLTMVLISFLMAGCKALEVLVTPPDSNPATNTQTTNAPQAYPSGTNWYDAVGGCGYFRGKQRGSDPDPWTTLEFVVNKDIDVAYPRIMREFGYTRLEPVYDYETKLRLCDIHLRYVNEPGSHYQMRNFIKHAHGNEELENTIEVDLAKEDVGKVRIRVSYYSGNTKDKAGYEASLRNRVEQALR